MLDELGHDHLLLDRQRLGVADQVDELMRIVEQVVLPRVLGELELLPGVVLLLRCVDFADDFLEGLGDVPLEILRLPVINGPLDETEAHLRPESLGQLALFGVELYDLVCDTVNVLFQGQLVDFEHQGGGGVGCCGLVQRE